MGCDVSKGRNLACKQGSAGLLAIFVINRNNVKISFSEDDPTQVGAITTKDTEPEAVNAYRYELDNDGNNYVENVLAGRNEGTKGYEQVLTLVMQSLLEQDKPQFDQLAAGRPIIVVHYRNGKSVLMGRQRGADTAGSNNSGGTLNDFQGYNLTLTANENRYAPFLYGSTEDDPFAGLDTPKPIVIEGDNS